mgnify:CR=1 FL=1
MFERITTYLAEQFDFPKDSLHWDTTFKSLQLDSMDMVEMMMDMEEELGVDFDQNDMAELTTIGELADYIEKKLNKPIERKSCGDVMLEKIDAAKEEQKEGAAQ